MGNDDFTVMLDKREGIGVRGAEFGGAVLRGMPFLKEGVTGVADSIDAVLSSSLIHVPTYRLIAGRAFAGENEGAWSEWHDSNAERITAHDEKGILGAKGAVYALDIQNGGLFVWNPKRIREAINGRKLVNYALQLGQGEVDGVLDAMKRNDYAGLKQIVHGRDVAFAGDYKGFLEASARPDFVKGVETTYLVLRQAEEARQLPSERKSIAEQRENPDLIIASGGKRPLGNMLDKASSFGWEKFGSWHDGYNKNNTGRVLFLSDHGNGLLGYDYLDDFGRSVGVAPEALDAFYRQKDVNPLEVIVSQARRTGKPVQHGDGVIIYVPSVQVRE